MGNIKRVAGASAGAIIATLIALEFTSEELKEFLEQDLRRILVGKKAETYVNILFGIVKCIYLNQKCQKEKTKTSFPDSEVSRKILQRCSKLSRCV